MSDGLLEAIEAAIRRGQLSSRRTVLHRVSIGRSVERKQNSWPPTSLVKCRSNWRSLFKRVFVKAAVQAAHPGVVR
jgi:hypothetical protein